jgi:hypothetical protein
MYLLVPHDVSDSSATLWIAAVAEATSLDNLQLEPSLPNQTATPLQRWPENVSQPPISFREIQLTNLSPRQSYVFRLNAAGTAVASAKLSTLPETLPLESEKPFTVLLGSCFAYLEDEDEKVGNTYLQIPTPMRPDIKILAGDQVYLDSPWYKYLAPHNTAQLQAAFLKHYRVTWGQAEGFGRLLREGANFFTSDDHEYWNNAPNSAPHLPKTWTANGRTDWLKIARELFAIFQTRSTVQEFSVPPVSFLVVDTRINRAPTRTNFMDPADLQQVAGWVNSLDGPGVLVIGQPILRGSTSHLKGHLFDWNLPDYLQYDRLTDIIGGSQHSLVILTGDVHYGRVAWTTLRSGAELIEIISSPMSLVEESAKGKWEEAPAHFPPVRVSGRASASLARNQVVTEVFSPTDSHFLTLEFTRRGEGAHFRLRHWPIIKRGISSSLSGKLVWERTLR